LASIETNHYQQLAKPKLVHPPQGPSRLKMPKKSEGFKLENPTSIATQSQESIGQLDAGRRK